MNHNLLFSLAKNEHFVQVNIYLYSYSPQKDHRNFGKFCVYIRGWRQTKTQVKKLV